MITITKKDSVTALKNDYIELVSAFNPQIINIVALDTSNNEALDKLMARLSITVNAPTHYLDSADDVQPKQTSKITFYVDVYENYPQSKPTVYYNPKYRLASVNVFKSGHQCIDSWRSYSSLLTAVEKTIKDIIHLPDVANYDSKANTEAKLEKWQRTNTPQFPTLPLGAIYNKAKGGV